jgi:hypothetical protein
MKKQILSAVFITLISTTALAEEIAIIPFSELDTNSDDALSATEAEALPELATQLSMLDINGDGQLDRAEYAVYQIPAPAAGDK